MRDELFARAGLSELMRGYLWDNETESFACLFCGMKREDGVVVPLEGAFYTAERAMKLHVAGAHGDVAEALIGLGASRTGLSETQAILLSSIARGRSDREIAGDLGGKAVSTVRNHRFHMRRRKNEARLFLAIMELLDERSSAGHRFMDFHADLTVDDERSMVTEEERREIREKYFREGGTVLKSMPKKQKAKIVVLNGISELFDRSRRYTEKEVNEVLAGVHDDYVSLRRYLIEYGFLSRKPDGSEYWLT